MRKLGVIILGILLWVVALAAVGAMLWLGTRAPGWLW